MLPISHSPTFPSCRVCVCLCVCAWFSRVCFSFSFCATFFSSTLISLVYASSFSTFFFRFSRCVLFCVHFRSWYFLPFFSSTFFSFCSFAYWRWWRRLFCVVQAITGMVSRRTQTHSRATTNIISSLYFDGIGSWDDVQRHENMKPKSRRRKRNAPNFGVGGDRDAVKHLVARLSKINCFETLHWVWVTWVCVCVCVCGKALVSQSAKTIGGENKFFMHVDFFVRQMEDTLSISRSKVPQLNSISLNFVHEKMKTKAVRFLPFCQPCLGKQFSANQIWMNGSQLVSPRSRGYTRNYNAEHSEKYTNGRSMVSVRQ